MAGAMGGDMLFATLEDAIAAIEGKDTYQSAFSTYYGEGSPSLRVDAT